MHLTRLAAARPYTAPDHVDMRMLRLQGREAGPSDSLWLGLSHLLPGGHTAMDAAPVEKFYLVVEGEVTVIVDGAEATLAPLELLPHRSRRAAAAGEPDQPSGLDPAGDALPAGDHLNTGQ